MEQEHENKGAKKSQHKPKSCDIDNALRIIAIAQKKVAYFLQTVSFLQFTPLHIYEAQEGSEESTLQNGK